MQQLHADLTAVVNRDNEQEILEPAASLVLASVRAALESLPADHFLRSDRAIDLLVMKQLEGDGEPLRQLELLMIVGQLKESLPNASATTRGHRRIDG